MGTWYSNSASRHGAAGHKGDMGELLVEVFCKATGRVWEDKNDYNSQVNLKIDCVIDGVLVDVKTNAKGSEFPVELDLPSGAPGWIYKTKADEIWCVDLAERSIYRYNVTDMIEYLNTNKGKYPVKPYKGTRLAYIQKDNEIVEKIF